MSLNAQQVEQLLKPVNPKRVLENRGQSHLAGWDVEAHLTRVFGFEGWDKRIRSVELVCEDGVRKGDSDRVGWFVTYRCLMTLIIRDPQGNVIREIDDGATGSAENLPQRGEAHDFALKNAITYALKRCAKDLGDQFGLSLYNKGSRKPTIIATLAVEQSAPTGETLPDEVHPDTEPGAEDGSHDAAVTGYDANDYAASDAATAEALEGTVITPRPDDARDDPALVAWGAKIDEITDAASAMRVRDELAAANLDPRDADAISGSIDAKLRTLNGSQPARPSRPKGPPAEERGAKPVPTGNGDDGDWVQGWLGRVAEADIPARLVTLQAEIGNAVRAKKITPAKSAELSKAVQARRRELEGAAA